MPKVNLVSLKKHRYAGEALKPGDDFSAPVAHAKVLIALKRAKKAPPVTAAEIAGLHPYIAPGGQGAFTDEGDVAQAEQTETPEPTAAPEVAPPVPEVAAAEPKPKRAYNRKSATPKK